MTNNRLYKGSSLFTFPSDYTVIDIETTGLSPAECEIIEIAALKIRKDEVVSDFSYLIKPTAPINSFITSLTGITNSMVSSSPDIKTVLSHFKEFTQDDILMGYNVHFDINFIYDNMISYLGVPLTNDFVDVLRFSRKALPMLRSKSQTNVAEYLGVSSTGAHRALNDCIICNECYKKLRNIINKKSV